MSARRRWGWALLAASPLIATCTTPTDLSTGVWVTIDSPSPVLLRGASAPFVARVWFRGEGSDSVELRNVTLLWSSANPSVATVEPGGQGRGRVTGVNSGYVQIRAIAPGYEDAAPAVFPLRVANPLEIDSISPDTVRYGERVTMHGIGVGDLFFVGLGSSFLVSDSLSIAGDKSGLSRQSFWVPWPALTGNIFAAGSGQLISAADTTVVLPWDLYEPNEVVPTSVALDGPPPFAAAPTVRFFNPALAFEDRRDFPFGFDWYRLTAATLDSAYTIVFIAPALGGAHVTYLTDRLRQSGASDTTEWRLGSGEHVCKGYAFRPEEAVSDSVVIALKRLPSGTMDLVSGYVQEGRYLLAVVQGYGTHDARFVPDRFEENDLCRFADDNFANQATHIELSKPFAENMTIDNAHDVDWIRFRVSGLLPQPVAIRTTPHPFGASDRSDIDLYLMSVPNGSQGLNPVAQDLRHGSASAIDAVLFPGDYYLAVVDSAGVPTRYGLCIAAGSACTTPQPPPPVTTAVSGLSPLSAYVRTLGQRPTAREDRR